MNQIGAVGGSYEEESKKIQTFKKSQEEEKAFGQIVEEDEEGDEGDHKLRV